MTEERPGRGKEKGTQPILFGTLIAVNFKLFYRVGGATAYFATGTAIASAVNGVATFTGLSLTTAGAATLTVRSTGLASGTSSGVITPAAATKVVILPAPASSAGPFTAGKTYTIAAMITDQYGNTVTSSTASATISATVSGKSASFASGVTTVAVVNGVATFTGLSLTTAGAVTLTVSSTGLVSGTSSSTITPAAASQVMIQPITGPFTAGGAYTISAVIADQYGNTVTNSTASVKIAATVGGNTASFASGITTVAAVNGVATFTMATFTGLSLTTAGNAILTVSSPGLTSGISSGTITPAAASQVVIPRPFGNFSVTAGQLLPLIPATIADQYGNTVTSNTAIVTITATVAGQPASFASGATTAQAVNGVATFTGLSLTTLGIATLTVSSGGLTSGTSDSFTIVV